MTFFYLTAVKGDIPVHLLETVVTKRLDYLNDFMKGNSTAYNEFVVEGSLHDNVGHFMLCVITILADKTSFSQFLFNAEVELFKHRLSSLTAYDMRSFAKKLLRSIRKHEVIPPYVESLRILCQHLALKDMAQHLCSPAHSHYCCDFNIKVNFKHCLSLIAKRQVELTNGMAIIPCGKWKNYLISLFKCNLKERLHKTKLDALVNDPRVMELLRKIKQEYFPVLFNNNSKKIVLYSKDVDRESKNFPPCMLNLHLHLREKHRLSHTQRFHYSLFLKDIGMPVSEAIDFWKGEYLKTSNKHHSCCHHWEKDEKKYLYGIRHMYGLEGRRKEYSSVNCQRIQSTDNAGSEGGCPFKSFNEFKPLLNSSSEQLLTQINELKMKQKYTDCCLMYLKSLGNNCDSFSFNFTPVEFYNIASKIE